MKINFKQGARRLVLAFIGFCVICALFFYFIGGCIFDNDFIGKVTVTDTKYNITENLQDFANEFLRETNGNYIWSTDFKCYPYKQYCIFNDYKFIAHKSIEVNVENTKHYSNDSLIKYTNSGIQPKLKVLVTMPSSFQYFLWQVWDFIKIFLIAGLLYGIYLLLELTICWIIKGFKD